MEKLLSNKEVANTQKTTNILKSPQVGFLCNQVVLEYNQNRYLQSGNFNKITDFRVEVLAKMLNNHDFLARIL